MISEAPIIINTIKQRRDIWFEHILRLQELLQFVLEGSEEGTSLRGRPQKEYTCQIIEDVGFWSLSELKRVADRRSSWRTTAYQLGLTTLRRRLFVTYIHIRSNIGPFLWHKKLVNHKNYIFFIRIFFISIFFITRQPVSKPT